jgi:hypothetical protein
MQKQRVFGIERENIKKYLTKQNPYKFKIDTKEEIFTLFRIDKLVDSYSAMK